MVSVSVSIQKIVNMNMSLRIFVYKSSLWGITSQCIEHSKRFSPNDLKSIIQNHIHIYYIKNNNIHILTATLVKIRTFNRSKLITFINI